MKKRRKLVTCEVCGKQVRGLAARHLQLHGLTREEYRRKYELGEDAVDCPLCGKGLLSERYLKSHLSLSHHVPKEEYEEWFKKPPIKPEGEEGIDFVKCEECDRYLRRIDNSHIQKIHSMSPDEYKLKHPNAQVACKAYLRSISDSVKKIHADPNSIYQSEECKQKKSASLLKMWGDRTPEERHAIGAKSGVTLVEYYSARPELVAQISAKTKEQWANGSLNLSVFKSPTKPELVTQSMLEDLGLQFDTQYKIQHDDGHYFVDFFVESKFVVEVFGIYWHSEEIPGAVERDTKRLNWLTENGYNPLVIWDIDLKNNPEGCKLAIQSRL